MKHHGGMDGITITYCKPSGYAASAVNAAAALRKQLGLDAELIAARGGIFEVAIDGKIVVKKSRNGFPDERDIVGAVAAAMHVRQECMACHA